MKTLRIAATLAGIVLLSDPPVRAEQLGGTVRCKGTRDCANAVVYIAAIPGKSFPPPRMPVAVDQKGLAFVPHVQPVLVGTTVDFLNSDPLLHNVFTSAACADKFNLGTWPPGEVRSYTFKRECVAPLLCNPHPEMLGYVVVVSTPYFAVTDKAGRWSIPEVPVGQYTLTVWHPRLKGTSRGINAPAEGPVDFEIAR